MKAIALLLCLPLAVGAQQPAPKPKVDPVEKIGDNLFRIGNIRVDTAKHELSVKGKVNEATALEFIAGTKGGAKGYETAFELDTDAILFNMGLILIGLDKSKGVANKFHFDPNSPQGDPVEITVEWDGKDGKKKYPAEELIWNLMTKSPLAAGQWVYTGSTILEDGRFLAELEGVLVGFVHTPAPVIERSSFTPAPYGAVQLNPNVGLTPGTPITVTVKASPKSLKH